MSYSRRAKKSDPYLETRSGPRDKYHRSSQPYEHYSPVDEPHPDGSRRYYPEAPTNTYGTYIWPLDSGRYSSSPDPTRCSCTCCPHPHRVLRSNDHSRVSGARPQGDRYYEPKHGPSSNIYSPNNDKRRPEDRVVLIDVVDKSNSDLRSRYGRMYPLSLTPNASIDDIVSFLAPDKRRAKVLVHWKDGDTEPLDELIPMEDLKRLGQYLEVKEKKRVHWA